MSCKPRKRRSVHPRGLVAACPLSVPLFAAPALAQETASLQVPRGNGGGEATPDLSDRGYTIPGILPSPPPSSGTKIRDIRPRLMVLVDRSFFGQDSDSIAGVGEQQEEWALRGAPELAVRCPDVDLPETGVDGGRVRRTDPGFDRWATRLRNTGIASGHVRLDRNGLTGETDTLPTRTQWVY